jgi:hypothetical protein
MFMVCSDARLAQANGVDEPIGEASIPAVQRPNTAALSEKNDTFQKGDGKETGNEDIHLTQYRRRTLADRHKPDFPQRVERDCPGACANERQGRRAIECHHTMPRR